MKSKIFKILLNSNFRILIGLSLGILTGYLDLPVLNQSAETISQVFINLLRLVSTPIIFLSILSTVSGMNNFKEFKLISKKLIKYTLLTTYLASFLALVLYLIISPASNLTGIVTTAPQEISKNYLSYIIQIVPSDIITPFSQSNVISVLFLAILFSCASLALPNEQRKIIHGFLSSFSALFMKIASWIVTLIPIAIWSFIALLMKEIQGGLNLKYILLYLITITLANLLQAFVILPLFTYFKGVSPFKLSINMMPALSFAFFSKSSSATLPMTMRCAEERAEIPKKLSNLAFPLCTAINMNGCAAFILTTVLFVSMSSGVSFSLIEMLMWTIIATVAALGNAGVPMGCYFLSTAFLAAMNVPLNLMAIILPFYALIDMLETAVNVWSDACVVAVLDKELEGNPIPLNNTAEGYENKNYSI
jgi:Na+/H+-dicarboxylate symporter